MKPNTEFGKLKKGFLFREIERRTDEYAAKNPDKKILRLGVGDVTLPLCNVVIDAMHKAVDEQANASTFHGYLPEVGLDFIREAISGYYKKFGVSLAPDEVFISCGAADDLADIAGLFDKDNTVYVLEPAYPVYVDNNVMEGRKIVHLNADISNSFLPLPEKDMDTDIIYICSPNNPTGAAYDREKLKKWVDFANEKDAVIIYDAAYEIFVDSEDIPHSIYEIEGADTCAIEICSLSKTAGFTGTRCGYTAVPKALERGGMNLNAMWVRSRETRTNSVSYIIQRGAEAVFTEEGQRQIHENIKVYKQNAHYLTDALDKLGIWYTGGKNAPYIWLKCPNGMGSWEFFDYLLNEISVVGTPGEGFGECGKGFFRFSTFGSPADTQEAAERLVKLLSK